MATTTTQLMGETLAGNSDGVSSQLDLKTDRSKGGRLPGHGALWLSTEGRRVLDVGRLVLGQARRQKYSILSMYHWKLEWKTEGQVGGGALK